MMGQGIQTVESQTKHTGGRHILFPFGGQQLAEIGAQRQGVQIPGKGKKLLQHLGILQSETAIFFVQSKLAVGKQLPGPAHTAAFPPDVRGFYRDFSIIFGHHRQQPVAVPPVHRTDDQTFCGQMHESLCREEPFYGSSRSFSIT